MSEPPPVAGDVVEDRFEIFELVDTGGIASVYFAEDRQTDRRGALKLISLDSAADVLGAEESGAALQRKLHASVPAVAEVYDFGRGNRYLWIFMELIRGPSLAQTLRERGRLETPMPVHLALQMARILDTFHRGGPGVDPITHGDVKPQNIRIDGKSEVRLLDFGLAQRRRGDGLSGRTEFHSIPYASPERLRRGLLTPAADLWGLGVTLYEMLAGRLPFPGHDDASIQRRILDGRAADPLPAAVDPALRSIVERCLALEPRERYRTATALAAALQGVARSPWPEVGQTVRTQPSGMVSGREQSTESSPPALDSRRAPRGVRKRRAKLLRRSLFALALGALAVIYPFWLSRGAAGVEKGIEAGDLDRAAAAYHALSPFDLLGLTEETGRRVEDEIHRAVDSMLDDHRHGEGIIEEEWRTAAERLECARKIGEEQNLERAQELFTRGQVLRAEALSRSRELSSQAGWSKARTAIQQFERAAELAGYWPAPRFATLEIRLHPDLQPEDRRANLAKIEDLLQKSEASEKSPTAAERRLWVRGYAALAEAANAEAKTLHGRDQERAFYHALRRWQTAAGHGRHLPAQDVERLRAEEGERRLRRTMGAKGLPVDDQRTGRSSSR